METRKITLGDKTYELKPTYWTIMLASEKFNEVDEKGVRKWSKDNIFASMTSNFLACLLTENESLTIKDVAQMLPAKNMNKAIEDVGAAIEEVMKETKEEI